MLQGGAVCGVAQRIDQFKWLIKLYNMQQHKAPQLKQTIIQHNQYL